MALIKKLLTALAIVIISFGVRAQPGTRLMVFNIEDRGNTYAITGGEVIDSIFVGDGIISPDREEVYYIKHSKSGAEVIAYDFASKTTKVLSRSGNGFAKIRVTPDHKFISAFRDAADAQAIVRFPVTGGEPTTVMSGLQIENYTWIDDNSILLLEKGNPNSLYLMTIRPQKKVKVATNVGYTLVRSERQKLYAFIHKQSVDTWNIKVLDSKGEITIAASTMPESEIFAILPNGDFLMASEGNLFCMKQRNGFWVEVKQEQPVGEIVQISADEAGKRVVIRAKEVVH